MAVPKYDEMMLSVLRILADGREHSQSELADKMAEHFRLTPGWIRKTVRVRLSYWRSLRTKLRYGLLHLLDVIEVTLNFASH